MAGDSNLYWILQSEFLRLICTVFVPVWPKVSFSHVSFYKPIYSRCSNTETSWAGASQERPPTKKPLDFYAFRAQAQESLSSSSWVSGSCCVSVSNHHESLATAFRVFVWESAMSVAWEKTGQSSFWLFLVVGLKILNLVMPLRFGELSSRFRCWGVHWSRHTCLPCKYGGVSLQLVLSFCSEVKWVVTAMLLTLLLYVWLAALILVLWSFRYTVQALKTVK